MMSKRQLPEHVPLDYLLGSDPQVSYPWTMGRVVDYGSFPGCVALSENQTGLLVFGPIHSAAQQNVAVTNSA